MNSGLHYGDLPVTDLARLIAAKEISPVEVMEDTLDTIERWNPSINAFVFLDPEGARATARLAEQKVVSGESLGLLHGVPTALKDLFDFNPGWPTTFGGIRALRDHRTQLNCVYAERMKASGAILVGKTNSPVMGFRGTCDNPLFGPTSTPFDLTRNSGGSSGGSASAVASGLLGISEGTDGGGSIRIPAAWCNVVGFKPSFGRVPFVSRPNGFGGTNPFLFEGALTRSVADAALGLQVLCGPDPRDPYSCRDDDDFLKSLGRSIKGLRVAFSPDMGVYPVDREVASVVAKAVGAFEECGAHVIESSLVLPHDQHELSDLWCRLIGTPEPLLGMRDEGYDFLGAHRSDLPEEYLYWAEKAFTRTVLDLSADQVVRMSVFDAIQSVFETADLLVTPTVGCLPVLNAEDGNTLGPVEINGVQVDPCIGWCLTYVFNFTGHPAVSVPAGLSSNGLPVGLQIVGRIGDDATLIAAASAFEHARPWSGNYKLRKVNRGEPMQ